MTLVTGGTRKRKLPAVGIYDPNYSEDPQFGNVSTLKDGWKRMHLHMDGPPQKATNYIRFQCIVPECTIPTLSRDEIKTISEIEVVVIKNFVLDMQTNTSDKDNIIIGICDVDNFSKDSLPPFDPEETTTAIPINRLEALFIANRAVCYEYHGPYKTWSHVSNFSERGYVMLQNYFNIFLMHTGASTSNDISFNCYIDYEICKMKYKDAIAWRADFEKLINPNLRYRAGRHNGSVVMFSRGDLNAESVDDPTTFDPIVNNSKVYKVSERTPLDTLSPEVALSNYVEKYLKGDGEEKKS